MNLQETILRINMYLKAFTDVKIAITQLTFNVLALSQGSKRCVAVKNFLRLHYYVVGHGFHTF